MTRYSYHIFTFLFMLISCFIFYYIFKKSKLKFLIKLNKYPLLFLFVSELKWDVSFCKNFRLYFLILFLKNFQFKIL